MRHKDIKIKSIVIAVITLFTALCLSSYLFAYSSHEGSHADLVCTDCHLTQPDPDMDTIDTVDFITTTLEDLCFACHSDITLLEQTNYCLNCHDQL
ncbi:MAG: cytochrome c3 family protein [Nitrospirota bacterium]